MKFYFSTFWTWPRTFVGLRLRSVMSDRTLRRQDSVQVEAVNEILGKREGEKEWKGERRTASEVFSSLIRRLSGDSESLENVYIFFFTCFCSVFHFYIALVGLKRIVSHFSQCDRDTEHGFSPFLFLFLLFVVYRSAVIFKRNRRHRTRWMSLV